MSTKSTQQTVGFVRQHSKHKLSEQRRVMELHGITRIYDDFDLCVRQRRHKAGDVVAVKRLMLLADPKRLRTRGGMRQSLREAIQAIEAAGATVLELDTGRRRDDPSVSEDMLLDAIDDLSRTRVRTDRIGRPPRVWTDEQRAVMARHWHDLRYRTNEDAAEAVRRAGVPASVHMISKAIGPSGRGKRN